MQTKKIFRVRLLCLLLMLPFLYINLPAENSFRQDFDTAGSLYEEGRYNEALGIFLEAEKKGGHWKLFYNIGNCYYKTKDFVKAKIYYLRAERLKPFEPSIQKNIGIVNKKFNDQIEAEKSDFISGVIKKTETLFSIDFVSILLLLSIFILNLFIFLLIKKGKSRFLIYGVSFSLIIAILFFSYHVYRVKKQNLRDTAVIVKTDSTLRSGPGESNTILFKVNPGLKVKIIDKSRDWLQVSASKEIAGWIEESDLEKI
ncbi:MAG: SH3 domain-containing protein [Candidatus Aminicenantes bacterium]|nr:SH3 domain-containing protein [Candidatus Aminicenantes bacterium]